MKSLDKAQSEIQAGRLWRAKEILRGAIGQQPYDLRLYLEYGELLLRLGDLPEAGKYLFLAGSTESRHEEAVSVFLSRWGNSEPELLYSRFPSRARLQSVTNYPKRVQETLTDDFKPPPRLVGEPVDKPKRGCLEAITLFGCGLLFFALVFLLVLGIKEVVDLVKST